MPALLALLPASLMTLLWTGLRLFIAANILGFILRVVVALGFYFFVSGPIVQGGIEAAMDQLPLGIAQWVGFLNIDRYFSAVLSAAAVVTAGRVLLRRRFDT